VADDDDRSRDAAGAVGPGWPSPDQPDLSWADAVAPDDISELARDVAAYHRECRAQRRQEMYQRLTRHPGATPLTLVLAALTLVALVTALLTVMGAPRSGTSPSAARLATPRAAPGARGGLLPAVTLGTRDGAEISAQTLRPGAVALLPDQCDCDRLVTSLDAAADSVQHMPLFVVAPSAYPSSAADTLQGRLRAANNIWYDAHAGLRAGVKASGLTLVLVGRDGRIYDIKRNVTSTQGMTAELVTMLAGSVNTA
jgi:hypothetical protein